MLSILRPQGGRSRESCDPLLVLPPNQSSDLGEGERVTMPFETFTVVRLCGIAGILGALIMGMGDLLYHHFPGSTSSLAVRMSSLPQDRLVSAGTMGLVGSWLYVLGAVHL